MSFQILLIENDERSANLVKTMVSGEPNNPFEIKCVNQLDEGLKELAKGVFDLVLLDLNTPDIQGLDGIKKINAQDSFVPVIIMASVADEQIALEAVRQGAQDYLLKGVMHGKMLSRVMRYAIERHRIEQELMNAKKELIHKIFELSKVNEELSRARAKAEEANQAKTYFLANMSHEIRTPLNAIIGFSNLLKSTSLNADQKDYVDTVIMSSEHLLALISDILDIIKIEAGQVQLEEIDFNLKDLVEDIMKISRIKLTSNQVVLRSELSPDLPLMWKGDPTRVRQALLNLIGNATKFTKKGEILFSARLENPSRKAANEPFQVIRFSVKDTGIGIPKEKQKEIFDAFVQADVSTTREFGGTGLGLAIAKNLVEMMGGNLHVESEEGKGTELICTLPLKEWQGKSAILSAPSSLNSPNSLSGINVLVAEDDLVNQKLMLILLQKLGIKVDVASNGKEAVEKIRNNAYHLCLMDIQMPLMSGLRATQIVRMEMASDLPIIALTAAAFSYERERCLNAGMNDFLTKPIDVQKLKEKILLWIGTEKPIKQRTTGELGISDELYLDLIHDFLKQADEKSKDLPALFQKSDYENMKQTFHFLKGAAGNLRIEEIRKWAEELELLSGEKNRKQIEKKLPLLQSYLDELRKWATHA